MNATTLILQRIKLPSLFLGIGLIALSIPTQSQARCCANGCGTPCYNYVSPCGSPCGGYYNYGCGGGCRSGFGTAAAILTGAAVAQHGYYYGPSYNYGPYPYYRTGYYNGSGNYYGNCQRVYVRCYPQGCCGSQQCYRVIRWVC